MNALIKEKEIELGINLNLKTRHFHPSEMQEPHVPSGIAKNSEQHEIATEQKS